VQGGDLEAIRELAREGARLLVVPRLEIGWRDLDVRIARELQHPSDQIVGRLLKRRAIAPRVSAR
jgi:hypothetical protein